MIEGELVHLEVTGVQHQAGLGADRDGEPVGDGVVHGQELEVERASLTALPFLDLDQAGRDAVLFELGADEGQSQFRPDDRDVLALAQQVGDPADVVFVAVGEHDRLDVL